MATVLEHCSLFKMCQSGFHIKVYTSMYLDRVKIKKITCFNTVQRVSVEVLFAFGIEWIILEKALQSLKFNVHLADSNWIKLTDYKNKFCY